jgi:hypothetical protein
MSNLKNRDTPAQPCPSLVTNTGLTKREHFAALALSGFIAKYGDIDVEPKDVTNLVKVVDLILDALEKK